MELIYQRRKLFSNKDRTKIFHSFYKSLDGELFITDGFKTIKKVRGLKIAVIAASLAFRLLALVYVLFIGCINLIRHKPDFKN